MTTEPPATVLKGQTPRRPPLQIIKMIGRFTFGLSDGMKWNIRKLKRLNSMPVQLYEDIHVTDSIPDEVDEAKNPPEAAPPSEDRISQRLRPRENIRPAPRYSPSKKLRMKK
ncbi:MAG: hypothetical protein GY799_28100 [Desulfobulbaceae bacterium]|nr:hypothetical protein [Desulfobulbaceae bacterium]